jgi:hypothetical protein
MIKSLTRKTTNEKLSPKQVDKLLQQKDITEMSNDIAKTANKSKTALNNTSESIHKQSHSTEKIKALTSYIANKIKSPSAKSKASIQESFHSSPLENCKRYITYSLST